MFTHRKFSSEISLDYTLKTVFFFPNYYPGQDTPVGYLTFKNESIHTRIGGLKCIGFPTRSCRMHRLWFAWWPHLSSFQPSQETGSQESPVTWTSEDKCPLSDSKLLQNVPKWVNNKIAYAVETSGTLTWQDNPTVISKRNSGI